jgi:lysophospholipase L1-like esterase
LMASAMGAATHQVFAVAGETSGQGLARIQAVIDYLPTHVFLDFGVNDADLAKSVTPAQYEANMRAIIGTLLGRGIKVVLMSPILIAETGYLDRQRDSYMPVWQRVSRIHGVATIDCWSRIAAMTMHTSRAAFDALTLAVLGSGDTQHWSPAGNIWRRDIAKVALCI